MTDDDARAVLTAYLPPTEPPDRPIDRVITTARSRRRLRVAMAATAVSVTIVLCLSGTAALLAGHRGGGSTPVGGPGTGTSTAVTTGAPARSSAVVRSPSPAARSAAAGSCDLQSHPSAAATALSAWVAGKLAGLRPVRGPASLIQACEIDMGYTVIPPHRQNHAELTVPAQPGGPAGTETVTAAADRWRRLPDQLRYPCRNDLVTEIVACHQRLLPDGSRLVQRDFYDVLIHGDPNDPNTPRDKAADREVSRFYPDGREISLSLVYNGSPPWRHSFARHALSLDELAAIVTDPQALQYFPTG